VALNLVFQITSYGLLTTDYGPKPSYANAFPPAMAVAYLSASLRMTVAGQWRTYTALPRENDPY